MKSQKTLRWLLSISKRQLLPILVLSLTTMISSATFIVLALLSREIINLAVSSLPYAQIESEIIKYAVMLIGALLGQLALSLFDSHLKAAISGKLEKSLRHRIFETVTAKQYKQLSRLHSGEIINRFMSDVDIVVSGVVSFIPNALSIITKIVGGIIVIAAISKGFAAVVTLVGVAVILAAAVLSPIYKKLHKRVRRETGEVQSMTQECVENIVVVKTFSNRKPLLNRLDSIMNRLYKSKIFRNHVTNVANGGLFLVFTVGYYATLCWGALAIAKGGGIMDYGTLMAFLQIVSQIRTPLFNASGLITSFYGAIASAERIMELEALPDETGIEHLEPDDVYQSIKSITVSNLSFGYSSDKQIIKNSSFKIQKGQTVAVTGASGTGKSTLFRLLLGLFEPDEGQLFLETDDGKIEITAASRPLFAYVPQGNLVLSGTIADNVKFGNPDIDERAVTEALKAACLDELIKSLPDGINTVIGERGLGLSEGQIQRISVARALCCGAPILLLDECTSALDAETEVQMLKNITADRNKTVLFISHRDAALKLCDIRLSLENGIFHIA